MRFTVPKHAPILVLATLVFIVLLETGVYFYISQPKTANLSLKANDGQKIGQSFTSYVEIDSKGAGIIATDIKINYDNSKIRAESIEQSGNLLTSVLVPANIDPAKGVVRIVLGAKLGLEIQKGKGVIAKVVFRRVAPGNKSSQILENKP